jgi:hypothetical protein
MPKKSKELKIKPSKATKRTEPKTEPELFKVRKSRAIDLEFTWTVPERQWEPKTQVWYLSYAALFLLLILIAAKLGYPILIVALIAFMFLWFIQGTMKPWMITHKITTRGLYTNGQLYHWEDIETFWFGQKKKQLFLYFDLKKDMKESRLVLLVKEGDDEKIFDILMPKLKYADPQAAGYNIFAQMIYGKYLPIAHYLPDLDQPEFQSTK